jgi:hypothetical protein
MSTSSWNYTDTSGVTVTDLSPAALNFSADFSKQEAAKKNSSNEVTLTNEKSPFGTPETIRYAASRVSNVYSGTGIEAGAYSNVRSGVSALVQVNDVLIVHNDDNTVTNLPVKAHCVIQVPNNEAITVDVINTIFSRLVGACYEQGGTSPGPRLNSLLRGALLPKVLV